MKKMRLKVLILSLLFSLPFWWGVNIFQGKLENYFTAEISKPLTNLTFVNFSKNEKEKEIKKSPLPLELEAKSAISLKINQKGEEEILFEKDSQRPLPIASLTKLMTSFIAFQIYEKQTLLLISKEAVSQEENIGNFKVGERISVENLVKSALLESSNDAAFAIAEGIISPQNKIGVENFVKFMNLEAKSLGLENTFFVNPTGLDSDTVNYSSAKDLAKLTKVILEKNPKIFEISSKEVLVILDGKGKFHHLAKNTNKLVKELKIVGQKTGYTEKAGGCMILILKNKKNEYLLNVILGTPTLEKRESEMKKLINYLKENKLW